MLLHHAVRWMGWLIWNLRWSSPHGIFFAFRILYQWRCVWLLLKLTLRVHLPDYSLFLSFALLHPFVFGLYDSHLWVLLLCFSPEPFDFILHWCHMPFCLSSSLSFFLSFSLPLLHQGCNFQLIEVLDHLKWLEILSVSLSLDDLLEYIIEEFELLVRRLRLSLVLLLMPQLWENLAKGFETLSRLVVLVVVIAKSLKGVVAATKGSCCSKVRRRSVGVDIARTHLSLWFVEWKLWITPGDNFIIKVLLESVLVVTV